MTKIRRFLDSHRIFFGLFAFLLVYEIVIGNNLAPWRISEDFYVFYIVDFSMGFCSRLLPGAVYNLLVHKYDPAIVSVYAGVLTVLLFAGVCVLLEKVLKACTAENRPLCLAFVLLFLTGPASFSIFVVGLGIMDLHWMLLAALFFVFLIKKPLYVLIPPLFALSVAVHYGSMICYLPLMAIVLLYKISFTGDRAEKKLLWTVFALSILFAFGSTVYVMMFEERSLVYTMEEFDRILASRGAKKFYYYDYEFYKKIVGGPDGGVSYEYVTEAGNVFSRMLRHALAQMNTTFRQNFKIGDLKEILLAILAVLPVYCVVFAALGNRFFDRMQKNGLRKFALLLSPLLVLLMLVSLLFFSTDTFRWISHMLLCLMTLFFYVSIHEGDRLWPAVRRITDRIPVPLIVLFIAYYAVLAPTQ